MKYACLGNVIMTVRNLQDLNQYVLLETLDILGDLIRRYGGIYMYIHLSHSSDIATVFLLIPILQSIYSIPRYPFTLS